MNRLTKILLTGTAFATAGLISAAPLTAGGPDGSKLWLDKRAKCELCHGADGKGKTKMGKRLKAPDMTDAKWQKAHKDEDIVKVILEGFEREQKNGKKIKHKPLAEGTKAEAEALTKHIRSFAEEGKGKGKAKGDDKGEAKGKK